MRHWLRAIVVNRSRKHIRVARSRPRLIAVHSPDQLERGQTSADPAVAYAERDRLDRAFHQLPTDLRICVSLHYAVDWTVPDIAQALRIPEGTVKSRINAGMARMRLALAELDR